MSHIAIICVSSLLSRFFLGRNAAHRDDAEAEIAHLVEDAVQGWLVGQHAGQDRLATVVVDAQPFEPLRPAANGRYAIAPTRHAS
jgi:hypothetical protein